MHLPLEILHINPVSNTEDKLLTILGAGVFIDDLDLEDTEVPSNHTRDEIAHFHVAMREMILARKP